MGVEDKVVTRLRNQYKTYALSTNVDPSSRKHLVHSQLCDKIAPT